MRYFNFKYISLCFLLILILLFILYIHFIFLLEFNDKKVTLKLKIKLLFKIININIELYTVKKKTKKEKKKKEQKGSLKNIKLLEGEFSNIINLMKKIKIEQLYSNIYFGNANPYLNIYTTTIVNGIYGNIANIFDIGKLYLNIIPNFTENKIKGSVRLHIKFRIIMIFKSIPIIIRIMLRKHRTKEGD